MDITCVMTPCPNPLPPAPPAVHVGALCGVAAPGDRRLGVAVQETHGSLRDSRSQDGHIPRRGQTQKLRVRRRDAADHRRNGARRHAMAALPPRGRHHHSSSGKGFGRDHLLRALPPEQCVVPFPAAVLHRRATTLRPRGPAQGERGEIGEGGRERRTPCHSPRALLLHCIIILSHLPSLFYFSSCVVFVLFSFSFYVSISAPPVTPRSGNLAGTTPRGGERRQRFPRPTCEAHAVANPFGRGR